MSKLEKLEGKIKKVFKKNKSVDLDKAWENSFSRKIITSILIYIIITIYFIYADFDEPYIGAIVPAIGFFLSTLLMPYFKNLWIEYIYKNNK